ncbi:hypothetical protein [Glycomyces arizonensis]|uniref:hypothetical protein n=1 Tax=Glycomyces arizonensis TaxID=256035 RepID=UPI00040D0501|nr:hypothetical protein [Glycomyces arizonensis]
MSDGQFEFEFEFTVGTYSGEAWQGVEFPTVPSPTSWTIAFGDTSSLEAGGSRAGCSAGACPHPTAHPAEADWQQLASAVPVPEQLYRFKPRCEGMAYPTEEDFRSAVRAVRPEAPDGFSLQRLREGWTGEVAARVGEWPERVRSKLAALAENWAGDDFDAFAAQVDQARSLMEGVLDDIEDTAAELRHREEAVYTLQGGDSGEIPYPAPMVGIEGEWSNLTAIHVRPAWWHGDCITMSCEQAERALELAGADPGLATEVREFIEEKVGERLSGLGALVSPVRLLAAEDAEEQYGPRVEAELAAYQGRQAAIDEDIAQKRADQSAEFAALATTGDDRPFPSSADQNYMDLASPEVEHPAAPAAPQATQDPSPVPPSGDGSTAREEPDEADETPWSPSEDDDDGEVSGGLAGGGFGGVAPGGGGGPAAVVSTASTTSSPFTASPTVAPLTTGGAGGTGGPRAAAVGAAPGSPPAKGSGAAKDKDGEETEKDDDGRLLNRETGNVWGYVPAKDDPFK